MFPCTFVHIRTFCQAPVTIEMVLASASKLSLNEQQAAGDRRGITGGGSPLKLCPDGPVLTWPAPEKAGWFNGDLMVINGDLMEYNGI